MRTRGKVDSAIHFINKYHWRITLGTGQYLMSHLEFGLVPILPTIFTETTELMKSWLPDLSPRFD